MRIPTEHCTRGVVCRQGRDQQAVSWGIGRHHQKQMQDGTGAGCGRCIPTGRCTRKLVCRQGREQQAVSWGIGRHHQKKTAGREGREQGVAGASPLSTVPGEWSAGRSGSSRLSAGALSGWAGGAVHDLRRCVSRRVCRQGSMKVICIAGQHQGEFRRSRWLAGQTSLQQERREGQ